MPFARYGLTWKPIAQWAAAGTRMLLAIRCRISQPACFRVAAVPTHNGLLASITRGTIAHDPRPPPIPGGWESAGG